MKKLITRNKMLSIFGSVKMDMPWRHNPELTITVDFDEYTEFIRTLARNKLDLLYFPISKYEEALSNEIVLLRYFYFDISRVIAYEVSLSMYKGVIPTAVLPDAKGTSLLLTDCNSELMTYDIDDVRSSMVNVRNEFFTDTPIPTECGRSRDLCRLAYLLRVATTTSVANKYTIKEE